jgi:hypothetical protein
MAHLLKWQRQPNLRGNNWRLTICKQRRRIGRVLEQNPSLKDKLPTILAEAYGDALLAPMATRCWRRNVRPACRRALFPRHAPGRSSR